MISITHGTAVLGAVYSRAATRPPAPKLPLQASAPAKPPAPQPGPTLYVSSGSALPGAASSPGLHASGPALPPLTLPHFTAPAAKPGLASALPAAKVAQAKAAQASRLQSRAQQLAQAGQRAVAAASRLRRWAPTAATRLQATGQRAITRANGTKVVGTAVGDGLQAITAQQGQAAEQALAQDAANTAALAQAGEIAYQLAPVVQQLQATNPPLAQQGQAIVDQCTNLVSSNPDTLVNVTATVAQIQTQANAWLQQAQSAGAITPQAVAAQVSALVQAAQTAGQAAVSTGQQLLQVAGQGYSPASTYVPPPPGGSVNYAGMDPVSLAQATIAAGQAALSAAQAGQALSPTADPTAWLNQASQAVSNAQSAQSAAAQAIAVAMAQAQPPTDGGGFGGGDGGGGGDQNVDWGDQGGAPDQGGADQGAPDQGAPSDGWGQEAPQEAPPDFGAAMDFSDSPPGAQPDDSDVPETASDYGPDQVLDFQQDDSEIVGLAAQVLRDLKKDRKKRKKRKKMRVLGASVIPSVGQTYTDPGTVRAVQNALKSAGYDPGPVDSQYGPKTAAAIRAWQGANDLDQTGVIDYGVIQGLGISSTGAGQAAARTVTRPTGSGGIASTSYVPGVPTAQVQPVGTGWWSQPLWTGAPVKRWQGAVGGIAIGAIVGGIIAAVVRR
jgi:hypothetical protein